MKRKLLNHAIPSEYYILIYIIYKIKIKSVFI
jgi:hypothetical protein